MITLDQKHDTLTFSPVGPHNWGLCYDCSLDMTLLQREFSSLKLAATEMSIFQLITYVFLIYSNYLPVYWPTSADIVLFDEEKIFLPHRNGENIELKLDNLTCNPFCDLTQCVLSEILAVLVLSPVLSHPLYRSGEEHFFFISTAACVSCYLYNHKLKFNTTKT